MAAIACDEPALVASVSPRWPSGAHHHLDDRGRRRARRGHVGLEPGQAGTRVPVLERAGHGPPGRNFERWYDLPERMLPAAALDPPTPDPLDAKRDLLVLAARSHGVGTARDLADYFRLNVPESRGLLAGLVDDGRLVPAEVRGWKDRAFLHPDARRPNTPEAERSCRRSTRWCGSDRTERIWGFRYRIEIYTPAAQRVHGYYVLPFLLDGDLVARVDLKADRAASTLLVRGAFAEARVHDDPAQLGRVAEELAGELGELARFLGLDGVEVAPNGDLAPALAATVADHP
ncbi:MAG: crosslink repair DNA glycosylase YcaQ family protein [Acidimicrobiales bacterium]